MKGFGERAAAMRNAAAIVLGVELAGRNGSPAAPSDMPSLTVAIHATDSGMRLGSVLVEDTADGARFTPNLSGLTAGEHGFHVHVNPDCGMAGQAAALVAAEEQAAAGRDERVGGRALLVQPGRLAGLGGDRPISHSTSRVSWSKARKPRLVGHRLPDHLRRRRRAVRGGQHQRPALGADAGGAAELRQQPVRLRAAVAEGRDTFPTRRSRPPSSVPHRPDGTAIGNGLYLFVQPTGTRSWVRRLLVPRPAPGTRARRRHARPARQGPRARPPQPHARPVRRRSSLRVPTFAEAARSVLEQKRNGWRGR